VFRLLHAELHEQLPERGRDGCRDRRRTVVVAHLEQTDHAQLVWRVLQHDNRGRV